MDRDDSYGWGVATGLCVSLIALLFWWGVYWQTMRVQPMNTGEFLEAQRVCARGETTACRDYARDNREDRGAVAALQDIYHLHTGKELPR